MSIENFTDLLRLLQLSVNKFVPIVADPDNRVTVTVTVLQVVANLTLAVIAYVVAEGLYVNVQVGDLLEVKLVFEAFAYQLWPPCVAV